MLKNTANGGTIKIKLLGKTGAFYIWKVSKKTNKKYKYYLPKDVQKQMGREYKEDNK